MNLETRGCVGNCGPFAGAACAVAVNVRKTEERTVAIYIVGPAEEGKPGRFTVGIA